MIPGGSADEEDLVSIDSHTALEEARLLRSDQPDHRVDFPLNEPPKPQRSVRIVTVVVATLLQVMTS